MSVILQRITTEYIAHEDRIRLNGACPGGERIVLWLTHRLLEKLIPALNRCLEKGSGITNQSNTLHRFAQEAANATHIGHPAVTVPLDSPTWLVCSIDIAVNTQKILLTFKNLQQDNAKLYFTESQLRQWLNMLFRLYQQAGWRLDVWPSWIKIQDTEQTARSVH